ncbi:unnamed protein product [Parnassius mnemosyne]|uniref:Uncharacterized protein n=1 Tax=Parnassius mnemosyne TaxID=213953 RepID=A0AAV1LT17_9NEOP
MSLSQATWIRYQYSPTVVSMERDMFAWNTSFPCITICPDKKLDRAKLIDYLKNSEEPDKVKLEEFLTTLANATFETFESVPDYNGIPASNYMDLILSLSPDFKPSVIIGATGLTFDIVPTITEMGLCFAMNSKIAVYNSPW